jgi:hypothetical protein
MARRGRSRKAGRRTPNGRISKAGAAEPINWHQYIQRLAAVDPIISSQTLCIVCRREEDWSREEQEQVAYTVQRAKNPYLSYPAGIAFELGLFRAQGSHDGRELMRAADIYAALHRQVWGHLTDDIERALADNYGGIDLLLEVGRVNAPAPPASFFRQLVAGTPPPPGETDPEEHRTDPEEYRRKRLRLADRYGAARAVLMRDLFVLNIVEAVVIEGAKPSFLHAGRAVTARGLQDRDDFVAGLKALAEHFGLFDDRPPKGSGDRRKGPADPVAHAMPEPTHGPQTGAGP